MSSTTGERVRFEASLTSCLLLAAAGRASAPRVLAGAPAPSREPSSVQPRVAVTFGAVVSASSRSRGWVAASSRQQRHRTPTGVQRPSWACSTMGHQPVADGGGDVSAACGFPRAWPEQQTNTTAVATAARRRDGRCDEGARCGAIHVPLPSECLAPSIGVVGSPTWASLTVRPVIPALIRPTPPASLAVAGAPRSTTTTACSGTRAGGRARTMSTFAWAGRAPLNFAPPRVCCASRRGRHGGAPCSATALRTPVLVACLSAAAGAWSRTLRVIRDGHTSAATAASSP
jgi:hypothetical protein